MHEYEILKLLVLIFSVSACVVFLLHKLNVPPLVGFIVSGVLIGPSGFGLAKNTADIELLADIGVMLLLFIVGIESSLGNLMKMRKEVTRAGTVQFLMASLLTTMLLLPVLGDAKQALFFGFLIALSSTSIVLKMLAERGEMDSPHGRIMLGVLIFQDMIVVPLMLITPVLKGEGLHLMQLGVKMGTAAALVALIFVAARWIVPQVLHQVVHVKSRELFIITIILLCLGTALLTSQFGLSLALGAFLAGLIVSESEYAHQAMSDILPFKDSFIGLFFVSLGMLMDAAYMADQWGKVIAGVALILSVKILTTLAAALTTGATIRPALIAGIGLAQIGEFSFLLAGAGRAAGLITGELYQLFLSSSLLTMLLTPFMIKSAPRFSSWASHRIFPGSFHKLSGANAGGKSSPKRVGHVMIVGFGLNGKNLARVLRQAAIPYVALEMNKDTFREMKKQREPIYYGDGTSFAILEKMGLHEAKVLVVAISDAASTRRILQTARRENSALHIIVRTRYVAEVEDLKKLGANEVIPEEFETSIEIFSKVLDYFSLPRNVINDYIDIIRLNNYKVLRKSSPPRKSLAERQDILQGIETDSYLVKKGSQLPGLTICETRLRAETGSTILAVEREGQVYQNPPPEFMLQAGDVLVLIGARSSLHLAMEHLATINSSPTARDS